MNSSPRTRLLFIAKEFSCGGGSLLCLRHMERLLPYHDIDLLLTGPGHQVALSRLPPEVGFYDLSGVAHDPGRQPLQRFDALAAAHAFPCLSPQHRYQALLGTSVAGDWLACAAFARIPAETKLLFLIDEALLHHLDWPTAHQIALDAAVLACQRVVSVSHGLAQGMASVYPLLASLPIEVLRPPIDPPGDPAAPAPRWPGKRPALLTVSRLCPTKQLSLCLRVHHRLKSQGLSFSWNIIGQGPEESTLRAEIQHLGMEDDFFLLGHVGDVRPWMRSCDAFALFSRSEGCPTVLLEALQEGRPVLSTDVHGARELIEDGHNGWVVPNEEEALATAVARVMSDQTLRDSITATIARTSSPADPEAENARLRHWITHAPDRASAPDVTILIPAYNSAAFIESAISSALAQDHSSLEVVVLDDASSDATVALASQWHHDPRFRIVRRPHNLGRVANYRDGIRFQARGTWVLVLDADDHLTDPTFVRRAREAILRRGDRRIVFAQAGHRVTRLHHPQHDVAILPDFPEAERLHSGPDYLQMVFRTGFFSHLGTLTHRRSALEAGFYTAPISASDMESVLRLALEGEVLVLNTLAGAWVHHGANASQHVPLELIPDNVRIFHQVLALARDQGLSLPASIQADVLNYEYLTLRSLLLQSIGKSARRMRDFLSMIRVIHQVHPHLLLHPPMLQVAAVALGRLARLHFARPTRSSP